MRRKGRSRKEGPYAIATWQKLKVNKEGSAGIYLQADSRARTRKSIGCRRLLSLFNITIRNYWPKPEAWDGTYKNPPIKKVQ